MTKYLYVIETETGGAFVTLRTKKAAIKRFETITNMYKSNYDYYMKRASENKNKKLHNQYLKYANHYNRTWKLTAYRIAAKQEVMISEIP